MARHSGAQGAHRTYTEGVQDFTQWLATDDEDGIAWMCTMLGALLLARAIKDSPQSERSSPPPAPHCHPPRNHVSDIHC
jgi:TetR/AcrR family transcriptional repressor of nem operon